MSSIDDRIVNMEFNNRSFMSGVRDSIGALDKLKQGLDLKNSTKNLGELENASKSFNLSALSNGIETVTSRLSTMGMVGITALVNLTNRAVDAGLRMAKSLTIQPINDGFAEYELKMGSIQTILANTAKYGTNLDDVTRSLDELNTYADKTIYNFGDMTRNIGLFTNAGIELESATSMIKGFSNEAAASGTNSQAAAGAAYQLSQALSAGEIRLMDWRSLTNAGMGNKNMQNGLIEIAEAMGTVEASGTSAQAITQDFNGSLEKGWMTAEVMSNYLQIMAGDMDEATQASLGLTDAQIEGFQKQQKTAEEAATKVRTWTQLIGTIQEGVGSGWAQTWDILLGNFDQATEMFTAVNDAVGPLIEGMSKARNDLLQAWADGGGRDSAINAVKNTWEAFLRLVKPIKEAFSDIFPAVSGEQLIAITKAIENFTEKLKMGENTANNVKRTFAGVFAIFDIGWMVIKEVGKVFARVFGEIAGGAGGVLDFTGNIGDFIVSVRDAIKNGDALGNTFEFIGDVFVNIVGAIRGVIGFFKDLAGSIKDLASGGFDVFAEGMGKAGERLANSSKIFSSIGKGLSKAWSGISKVFTQLYESVKPVLDWIGEAFGKAAIAVKNAISGLDINGAIGLLGVGVVGGAGFGIKKAIDKVLDFFKGGQGGVTGIIDNVKEIFGTLNDTLTAFQNNIKADTLMKIAIALGVLALSVLALSIVDAGSLATSLGAMTVMFAQLAGFMVVMEKLTTSTGVAKMPVIAAALMGLAIAVGILAISVAALSQLDWDELAKGLLGLGGILASVAGFAALLGPSKTAKLLAVGVSLIGIAAGVKILASAVKDLSEMDWASLGKGMAGLAAILLTIAGFNALGGKKLISSAVSMLIVGGAMKVLASALEDFTGFSWEELGRGMAGLAGAMAIMAVGISLMSGTIAGSLGLLVAASALRVLMPVIKDMSKLDWEGIGKAMVTLAGSLLIMAGGLYIMTGTIAGSLGLLVAAAALRVLMPVLEDMGKLKWGEIGKIMTVLAGGLLIMAVGLTAMIASLPGAAALVVAAAALTILVPVLQALGDMKWSEIWTGIGALGLALLTLAIGGILLLPALPGLLGLGIAIGLIGAGVFLAGLGVAAFATALQVLIDVGTKAAETITLIGTAVADLLPYLGEKLGEMLVNFATVITENQETFKNLFTSLLTTFITAITENTPFIINALFGMLEQILATLDEKIPSITTKFASMITKFLDTMAENVDPMATAATKLIVAVLNAISEKIPEVVDAGYKMVIDTINGISDAVDENSAEVGRAGGRLAASLIRGAVNGITAGAFEFVNSIGDMARSAIAKAQEVLDINSPSRVFRSLGGSTVEGFVQGVDRGKSTVENSAAGMADTAIGAVTDSVSKMKDAFEIDADMTPVIAPVLDLTNVQKSASGIGALFSGHAIEPIATTAMARDISAEDRARNTSKVDDSKSQPVTQKIELNQTNTSPKALSEIEIYRQTKNLLSTAKGAFNQYAYTG